jgi:3-oxoacyl-[acyl-carrier protein] reductase
MDLGLKDKAVLVFASSKGLGRGCATEFAREGARVMLASRTAADLERTRDEIARATGNRPECVVADVSKATDIQLAVDATVSAFGGLYALVNNAGGPPAGPFENFDDAAWQAAFELTLLSFIRSTRAALPHMTAAGGGRIVNVASSSTRAALPNLLLSNVFRTGIVGLTKSLAKEYGGRNVLLNVLCPGRFDTDRVAQLDGMKASRAGVTVEEIRKREFASIPMGRYGDPLEFGRVAAFLCSPANTYVTGQNIIVDGGLTDVY